MVYTRFQIQFSLFCLGNNIYNHWCQNPLLERFQKSGLATQAGHFKNEILVFPEILLTPITALHTI